MKCSINKKYYFLLLILLFAGGLPAKSSNLDKTKPEDIIRLASYNIRTKGDKGDKSWEVRLNALVDVRYVCHTGRAYLSIKGYDDSERIFLYRS